MTTPLDSTLFNAFYKAGSLLSEGTSIIIEQPSLDNLKDRVDNLEQQRASINNRLLAQQNSKAVKRLLRNHRKQRLGMDAKTGRMLTGINHLVQSLSDIIRTFVTTRVKRRHYGSAVFDRVDLPQNKLTQISFIASVADAIEQWEPRFTLHRVKIHASTQNQENGQLFCQLLGEYEGDVIDVQVAI